MARLSHFIPAIIIFITIIITVTITGVAGEYTNVGDSIEVTASATCPAGQMLTLNRLLADASAQPVARLVQGVWQADEVYAGRLVHHSTSSVILSHVNYNDGGLYVFACGQHDVSDPFQLKVVLPFDITVTEGAASTLPCHASTLGESVKRVRWEKNGTLVLEQDLSSRDVRYGTGFEGKASVSSDWHSRGDLSLTLKGVCSADEGDYICYIEVEDGKRRTRGDPANVRLRLDRRDISHMTCAPPPPPQPPPSGGPDDPPSAWHDACFSVVVLLVLSLAGNVGCVLWLKGCGAAGRGAPGSPAAHPVNGSTTGL